MCMLDGVHFVKWHFAVAISGVYEDNTKGSSECVFIAYLRISAMYRLSIGLDTYGCFSSCLIVTLHIPNRVMLVLVY